MDNTSFNENDPFHANAHLIFGFVCQFCDAELGEGDVSEGDLGENFLTWCVAISVLAKERGWVCIDDFKFLCPQCAKAHNHSLQGRRP
jgi:predicted HNH restriction endonuclease